MRHDLGLYEALWWVVIVSVFFGIDRLRARPARPRLFLALLPLLYGPLRFALDFLRTPVSEGGDVRYLGLTPGQYASLAAIAAGLALLARWNRSGPARADRPAAVNGVPLRLQ